MVVNSISLRASHRGLPPLFRKEKEQILNGEYKRETFIGHRGPILMRAYPLGTIGGPQGCEGYHEVSPPKLPSFGGVGGANT